MGTKIFFIIAAVCCFIFAAILWYVAVANNNAATIFAILVTVAGVVEVYAYIDYKNSIKD